MRSSEQRDEIDLEAEKAKIGNDRSRRGRGERSSSAWRDGGKRPREMWHSARDLVTMGLPLMRLMAAHDAARGPSVRAARCAVVTPTVDPRAQRKQHTTRVRAPRYHLHRAHVVPAARRGARAIARARTVASPPRSRNRRSAYVPMVRASPTRSVRDPPPSPGLPETRRTTTRPPSSCPAAKPHRGGEGQHETLNERFAHDLRTGNGNVDNRAARHATLRCLLAREREANARNRRQGVRAVGNHQRRIYPCRNRRCSRKEHVKMHNNVLRVF